MPTPPETAPPQPLRLPVPAPCTSSCLQQTPASLRLSLCTFFFPMKPRIENGGASPTKSFRTAHLYGFSSGGRTPCPKQSRPKDGGVVRPAGRIRKYGRAPHTYWRELMAERVASTCNCLMHICRMAEGWGEDEIKAGIAHRRSLHAVRKRSANNDKVDTRASAVSHLAGTCPEKSRILEGIDSLHVQT